MKVTKQETLYHEDHGATLKHKCGKKRIVALSLLFFIFLFGLSLYYIWPFFFYFIFRDNALIMMIITLLFIYNSILEQNMTYMNASGGVPGCAMIQE